MAAKNKNTQIRIEEERKNRSGGGLKKLLMGAAALGLGYFTLKKTGIKPLDQLSKFISGSVPSQDIRIRKAVTINKPANELYQYWRRLENLPQIMTHLESVRTVSDNKSHWVAKSPVGGDVEWDAIIVQDIENKKIAWRSVEPSEIDNHGSVRFSEAPGNRGTEVRVELVYEAPGGKAGQAIAKLLGEEPKQQITDDLNRFKQKMETGTVE